MAATRSAPAAGFFQGGESPAPSLGIVLVSRASFPATLTGLQKKKTGPSRFSEDFSTELSELSKFRIYRVALHKVRTRFALECIDGEGYAKFQV
jgi:hypothetical protein